MGRQETFIIHRIFPTEHIYYLKHTIKNQNKQDPIEQAPGSSKQNHDLVVFVQKALSLIQCTEGQHQHSKLHY